MTIEEFRNIKQSLLEILNKWDLYFENKRKNNDNTFTEEDEKHQENIIREYLDLQNKLLSSDLSAIPFEEWKDITLLSETELDLSKTHANIDFSLLKEFSYETINLKGCKVRGLEALDYKEDTFDEEFKKNYPDYFPDESIPIEIQNKFYEKKLEFKDLIEYPLLRKCVNKFSFKNALGSTSNDFIKKIGFNNAIKLFDEYPRFLSLITDNSMYFASFIRKQEFNNGTYDDAKEYVFNLVIEKLKIRNNDELRKLIPEEMKEKHPEAFLSPDEIEDKFNKELAEQFNSGFMTFSALRKFKSVLKNKIIEIGTCEIKGINAINKIYGNIWTFIDEVPESLEYEVADYLQSFYNEEDMERIASYHKEYILEKAIKYSLNRHRLNISLEKLLACTEYLPLEFIIEDEKILKFIQKCGLDRLINFNAKYNKILNESSSTFGDISRTVFGYMASCYKEEDEDIIINSDEDLYKYLERIIIRIKLQDSYIYKEFLEKYKIEFSEIFPKEFIDYKMLEQLLKNENEHRKNEIISNLNSNLEIMLKEIRNRPDLIQALMGKHIVKLKEDRKVIQFIDEIGFDNFLKIGSIYGEGIYYLIRTIDYSTFNVLIDVIKNNKDYEPLINDCFYQIINNKREFDIRCLPDRFKDKHPELYLHSDAPEELIKYFYGHGMLIIGGVDLINLQDLQRHPEWIPHLLHVNLEKCLEEKKATIYHDHRAAEDQIGQQMSIYKALQMKFTKEETLMILSKYGEYLYAIYSISIELSQTKEEIYDSLLETIYTNITSRRIYYNDKMPDEFKNKYPSLFLDKNVTDEELINSFYRKKITAKTIQEHPEWISLIKDKDLKTICHNEIIHIINDMVDIKISQKRILELLNKYGNYLVTCKMELVDLSAYNLNNKGFDSNNVNRLENIIVRNMIHSITTKRTPYDETAKPLIGELKPELFLDENAPKELKKHFYNFTDNTPLTFQLLKENKDWLPWLKEKDVLLSLKKQNIGIKGLNEMFFEYGDEEAIKIGMKNPESVIKMLQEDKFETLKKWYEKLHFIPHYTVMIEFPFEQSDKFMSSGKKWSQIMKIEKHNENEDTITALLKASTCFGVFDGDNLGYNKIIEIFTGIPRVISESEYEQLKTLVQSEMIFVPHIKDDSLSEEEKAKIANQAVQNILERNLRRIDEVYKKDEDGNYHLIANYQTDKEKIKEIRNLMEKLNFPNILTPDKAHKLFGGFIMKYEPDFRDFLLKNMEIILTSGEYISYISAMQKQWKQIKVLNSNRTLTLDLALAFVKSNQFENVEVGNDKLSEISSKAGYTQQEFDTLQKIYNYGKARVFNSIPRVKAQVERFTYEILRLDDPLAIPIGTLTDCCQEIGNQAELSMEHSIVSSHGRIIVIKDEEGNIVAQSWVWRNKNVLCFDNIEIPHKAFIREEKKGLDSKELTDKVFKVYQQAGEELILKDEQTYLKLLQDGKISQEEYESLKLAKVTVGIGNNDIAESLIRNAPRDKAEITKPLDFAPPVALGHGLYLKDSLEQYVIVGEDKPLPPFINTPTIYQDEFKIYDDSNMTQIDALMLQKLEYVTTENSYYLKTQTENKEHVVSDIAYNYSFNPETTRIIMNANFAIIYDSKQEEIVLGDIFYNITDIVTENIVAMQIRMALEQIKEDNKSYNTKRLDEEQFEIYNKAMSLDKEIDEERGISHGI